MPKRPPQPSPRKLAVIVADAERAAIERSASRDYDARALVLADLEGYRTVSMLDFLCPGRMKGTIALKSLDALRQLPPHHQRSIRKMTIRDTIDGQVTTIEIHDPLRAVELIGKTAGLFKEEHKHLHINAPADVQRLADATPEQLAALRKRAEAELKTVEAEIVREDG